MAMPYSGVRDDPLLDQHYARLFRRLFFCSITEHEGRIIQSRSEDSIINEIEAIRDTVPGFTGVISDLGGPTANMYMLRCKSPRAEQTCRRLSCVYPDICPHMDTNHEPTINLYRRARDLKGHQKILIASGVRYDIAVEDPRYIKELATHHVGGYLKIAPEHTEEGPLSKMMKPGMGSYDRFKELFDTYSKQAGKEQYLIPYFISAHPGTRDEDMVNLALWLKSIASVSTRCRTSIRRRWRTRPPCITPARTRWVRLAIRVKRWWCRRAINSAVCIKRCCATTIRPTGR
jgi:uncharacterized radical SAM protein YgiQ